MKYLVKLFVVTFFIIFSTQAFAEQKIVVLDMNYILNQSKAGKGAQDFLKDTFKKNQKKFIEQEKVLKKEESDLLGKKNVLSKEDYKKASAELRKKVIEYQTSRRKTLDKITSQRSDSRKKLLANIEPLIDDSKIQFVTIPTLGNSQSFGDLTNLTTYTSGASNSVRGIYAGNGATPQTTIEIITIILHPSF